MSDNATSEGRPILQALEEFVLHGVRYAYATGAMANGIASVELVEAGAKAGVLSFFGAAGLALGYRFRIHGKDLPGRPDVVFSARNRVVDIRESPHCVAHTSF